MECLSVVSVPGGAFDYCAVALYRVQARKDGVYTWRKVRQLSADYRSRMLARAWACAAADNLGVAFVPGVRHGSPVAMGFIVEMLLNEARDSAGGGQ